MTERRAPGVGPDIDLTLGVLKFPGRQSLMPEESPGKFIQVSVDAVEVTSQQPLKVRSGRRLEATVLVQNTTNQLLQLSHPGGNRSLYGDVVEPVSGEVANGNAGWAPLTADTVTAITAGGVHELSLRIYTDSRLPGWGYALPAGSWAVRA